MAGVRTPAGVERLLVERQGRDRVDPPGQRQVDRRDEVVVAPPGRLGGRPPGARRERSSSSPPGRGSPCRRLGLLGSAIALDARPDARRSRECPSEHASGCRRRRAGPGSAAASRPRRGRSPRADARHVSHRQATRAGRRESSPRHLRVGNGQTLTVMIPNRGLPLIRQVFGPAVNEWLSLWVRGSPRSGRMPASFLGLERQHFACTPSVATARRPYQGREDCQPSERDHVHPPTLVPIAMRNGTIIHQLVALSR